MSRFTEEELLRSGRQEFRNRITTKIALRAKAKLVQAHYREFEGLVATEKAFLKGSLGGLRSPSIEELRLWGEKRLLRLKRQKERVERRKIA